jgi:peptidoglycan/xylan/chitin deacetylase (PgdA/CDA1 family)
LYELIKNNGELAEIFTGRQEYAGRRDNHDRFLYRFAAHRNVFEPVVSRHLLRNGLLTPTWPENHKFAACLTHDVDFLYPGWRDIAYNSLRLPLGEILSRVRAKIAKNKKLSPYTRFRDIISTEAAYDARSTFYFKATRTPTRMDDFYNLADMTDDFPQILDMGCEIALHVGYYSYKDFDAIREEKERLEKAVGYKIKGARTHYLRFTIPETCRLLADAGLRYDTSYGYSDMVGFRNSVAHPFKPFDLNSSCCDCNGDGECLPEECVGLNQECVGLNQECVGLNHLIAYYVVARTWRGHCECECVLLACHHRLACLNPHAQRHKIRVLVGVA